MSQVRGSFVYYSLEHIFPDGFVPTHKGLRGSMQGLYTQSYKPHQVLKSYIIYFMGLKLYLVHDLMSRRN